MANVNDYPVTNGDIIDSDNQVVNIVDLLGGGTPVSNQLLNKNDFPIHSGLIIGSDNKLYDLAELISESGGTDDYESLNNKPTINNVVLSGNKTASDLGLATKSEVDEKLEESIVDVASLPTGNNIKDVIYRLTVDNPETIPGETATVVFNSATTDVDLFTPTLESTGLFNIVTDEGEMGVTYYAYPKNKLYVEYVTDNEYGTNIEYSRLNSMQWNQMGGVEVNSEYLTPGEVGTFTFTQPSTIVHHYTYSYYMGDSVNQTTTELGGSVEEPTASEIEAYEADILSVIS